MLKVRLIPTLLWKNVGLVKGVSFDSWRRIGTMMPSVKVYNSRDVDELMILDIAATQEAREPDYEIISDLAAECFVPLTVGGGISSIEHIRKLLKAGADKVAINSSTYDMPDIISEAASRFGSQCVVVSIDARRMDDGRHSCFSHSGTRQKDVSVEDWAREVERRGAGEILITSIDRDGTMQGYDIELVRMVSSAVRIPVIASGGAGSYQDMLDVLRLGSASAVAAASIFHFTEQTPAEAREFLGRNGVPVRNSGMRSAGIS